MEGLMATERKKQQDRERMKLKRAAQEEALKLFQKKNVNLLEALQEIRGIAAAPDGIQRIGEIDSLAYHAIYANDWED
jgi:hypothetical protein